MSIIQSIKDLAGDFILKREMKRASRNPSFINMDDAKTFGIVFDATIPEHLELVKKYVLYLREMKKKVKAFGYFDGKELPSGMFSKLEYEFFCKKDLNWTGIPESLYIKNFIDEEHDVLLDLNIYELFPLRYISTLSRAKFKVGRSGGKNSSIFDLMIEGDREKGLKFFLRNIDSYLFIINKKTDRKAEDESVSKI